MFLLIDNSDDTELFLALQTGKKWFEKKIKMSVGKQRPLLFFVEDLLKKNKSCLNKLTGVAVVVGKGRFTATRIAATTANALSLALNIPVVGLGDRDVLTAEKRLKSTKPRVYLSATYSGEAHIGNSKK